MTTGPSAPRPSVVKVHHGLVSRAADAAAALRDGADLVWVALVEPTPAELHDAVQALGLSPALVAEARAGTPAEPVPGEPTRRRRARVVERDGGNGVVLLTASYDDPRETVHLGLLTVLVQGPAVLSVARGAGPDLARVHDDLVSHAQHSGQLLEAVLGEVMEGYDQVLEELDDDVADVETEVFSDDRRSQAQRVYGLKRETLELQRAVSPLPEVVERLGCRPALRERALRVGEHVDRLDSLLDGVLDADLAQVGVRQNEDQRTISAWAAIALVPTVVAGIYGMNFQHMPELSWRYGYPAALGLVAVVCLLLRRGFKRNGWIGRSGT